MVTDGGGAGSFGASGAVPSWCWDEDGGFASPSPHDCAPYELATITNANASKLLARILLSRFKADSQAALFPLLTGRLVDKVSYTPVFVMVAIMPLLGTIALFVIGRKYRQNRDLTISQFDI